MFLKSMNIIYVTFLLTRIVNLRSKFVPSLFLFQLLYRKQDLIGSLLFLMKEPSKLSVLRLWRRWNTGCLQLNLINYNYTVRTAPLSISCRRVGSRNAFRLSCLSNSSFFCWLHSRKFIPVAFPFVVIMIQLWKS